MEDPWSKELQQGNNDPAILPDLYKPHFLSSIPSLYFVLTSIYHRRRLGAPRAWLLDDGGNDEGCGRLGLRCGEGYRK